MVLFIRVSADEFLAIKPCMLGALDVLLAPLVGMFVGMFVGMSVVGVVLMRFPEAPDQRAMIMPFVQASRALFREDPFPPAVLIAAGAHIVALWWRGFGIGTYVMLGCIGGFLMIVLVGGFEIPHKREVVVFLRMLVVTVPLGA